MDILGVLKVLRSYGFEAEFTTHPSTALTAAMKAGLITRTEAMDIYLCVCPVRYGWAS